MNPYLLTTGREMAFLRNLPESLSLVMRGRRQQLEVCAEPPGVLMTLSRESLTVRTFWPTLA